MESEYGKYIVSKPKTDIEPVSWGSGEGHIPGLKTHVAYVDSEVIPGAFYCEAYWRWKPTVGDHYTKAHTHDFDEVIAFFGSKFEDPEDLCGEVELWLGDEKHIITKSSLVFVPRGLKHCPLIYKRIDRPMFHFTTGVSSIYVGNDKQKSAGSS